jgi:hypothetical protein
MTTIPPVAGGDGQEHPAAGEPGVHPAAAVTRSAPEQPDVTEVSVLALAGRRPAGDGEWLVITEADSLPGSEFVAWVLPAGDREAHGGDVLVRLAPAVRVSDLDPETVDVSVWAVISGQLIPVAAWDRHNPDGWPEQIRPAVAFAMGLLTELEEHAGVWVGAYDRVRLDHAVAAARPGIPLRLTFPPADRGPRRI